MKTATKTTKIVKFEETVHGSKPGAIALPLNFSVFHPRREPVNIPELSFKDSI